MKMEITQHFCWNTELLWWNTKFKTPLFKNIMLFRIW
jgi:hypothetical protein